MLFDEERRILLCAARSSAASCAQVFPEKIGDFQIAFSAAEIDVRLVGTVKIRAACDAQSMPFGQLLHGRFIRKTVG